MADRRWRGWAAAAVAAVACAPLALVPAAESHVGSPTATADGKLSAGPAAATTGWSHIERMGQAEAGKISALASARLSARRIATVVRNAAGNLQVTVWELQYNGSVKRLGSAVGGPTSDVKIAVLAPGSFVTGARTEAGTLKLTTWVVVGANGEIKRLASAETGKIRGEFAVTTFLSDPRQRIVTAVGDAANRLKLISWEDVPFGLLKRLKDAGAGAVGQISLATYDSYPPDTGRLVTAVTTEAAKLKVIAWSMDKDGRFQRLGSAEGGTAKDVAAGYLSHRRIVTAARNAQDRLEVRMWDFDAQGNVSLRGSGNAGQIKGLDLAVLNAARVITAVRNGAGRLKLIAWDAIDDVVRLGDARAGPVGLLSIAALGSDWLVTPVKTAEGTIKVIAWREHGVSLLRGEWRAKLLRASPKVKKLLRNRALRLVKKPSDEASKARGQVTLKGAEKLVAKEADGGSSSPMWSARYEPGVESAGWDPMIAVGLNHVIVTQDHEIGFFTKAMKPLGDRVSATEFFSTFLKGSRPNGSRNEHSIQRHTAYPPKGAREKYPPGASVHCDPDAPWPGPPPCFDEFFDTRVYFDRTSRRFFILSVARATKEVNDKPVSTIENPLVRRYWAFAVSKSENPSDGFYQWMLTEAHWTDFPRLTVNDGVMVIEGDLEDYPEPLDVHPIGLKPLVYAFSVADLVKGKAYPRSHKLFPPDFTPLPTDSRFEALPLAHYGDAGGRTFFVARREEVMHVFSFKQPSDWRKFPSLERTSASLVVSGTKVPVGSGLMGTFRNGRIHLVWMKEEVAREKNGKNGLYSIRLVRLPLTNLATKPTASAKATDGFLYRNFGRNAPQDDPSDIVSYERPEITVNKDGHMVIVYGRVGYQTTKPLFPEVRYSVYYADGRGLRRSRLLHAGEYMPMEVKTGESKQTIRTPNDRLDHVFAVVDPADDRTVWVISEYADKADRPGGTDRYRTIVGKVTP